MKEELKLYFRRLSFFIVLLVVFPGISFGIWWLKADKNSAILILDKTVPNKDFREHLGIFWAMEYDKFVNPETGKFYELDRDYFGYFPSEDEEGKYGYVKDFSDYSDSELNRLAESSDIIYYADTYGVYRNDFENEGDADEPSKKVYGGLNSKEVKLIELTQEKQKTVVLEYNSMASPTTKGLRSQMENTIGVRWTGWVARYFDELDTAINKGLPDWLISNYLNQHDQSWPHQGPGLVFVKESGEIEIFEDQKDYQNTIPFIRTPGRNKANFRLPEIVPYPDWFDVVLVQREFQVISYYDIEPTNEGLERLRAMGLPRFFPAVVFRPNGKGRSYYIAGDFADAKLNLGSAKFAGLPTLWRGFYSVANHRDRHGFFWNYYQPLISQIFSEAHRSK
ncbi:MAG: hypothetical protein HLUCCX10_00825 [Algoriphagus marincola HL-49]|uniref:Uncharacterized protein n=1 Tax=Algoriphagus marincola HL-49 TaxID=1305737 RepID=A0A0P8AM56_9BACT|nr:MAG: hypothetical protein HLUCCX10_00825 [Algoriphagus marincola HL-49]